MPTLRSSRILAGGLALALLVPEASGAGPAGREQVDPLAVSLDWPWFRGPNRDGVSPQTDLLDTWPEPGPTTRWRVPLGSGFSSVSVWRDRAYASFGNRDGEYLAAFAVTDGSELWRVRLGDLFRDGQGDGPRSTPAIDDGRVFALGGQGVLLAADAVTGQPAWRVDLGDAYGASGPTWGFSSQPLIVGSLLLLDVGGRGGAGIVAFDKRSGAEAWRSTSGKPGYSSPILVHIGGSDQAVFFTGEGVTALDPASGVARWRVPWRTSYDVNAAAPIFVPPDRIFVSSGYGTGSALLRVVDGGSSVDQVWRSGEMKNQFSSSVLVHPYLFGFDNSILTCLDGRDGKRLWRTRGYGHGSLLYADGKLIVLGDRGRLALVQATPGEYVELAGAQIFDGKAWTPPALANGILYLRDEHEMVALQLGRSTPAHIGGP